MTKWQSISRKVPYTDSEENLLNFIQNGGLDVKVDRGDPDATNGELAKPPILEDSRNVLNLVFNLKIEKSKLSNTFNIILKNVHFCTNQRKSYDFVVSKLVTRLCHVMKNGSNTVNIAPLWICNPKILDFYSREWYRDFNWTIIRLEWLSLSML